MTPQSLKSAILQLAIQGKLVPQRPEDGVARVPSALNTEKRKARRHGEEMEPPFDIPESWRWVLLPQVADILYGFPFDSQQFNDIGEGMPLIRIRDVLPAKTKTFTTESCPPRYLIHDGDMLVGMDGNFNVGFWQGGDALLNQRVCKISASSDILTQTFLYHYLPFALEKIEKSASFVTVKHLSAKHLTATLVPLPPLPEQHRIVAKIEELLPLIDRYEQAWTKLEDFNRRFPADMQKSLFQIAIRGQLVEQRPEEGTGEDLYRKILATKSTRKDKKLPPIAEAEIPFEIPDSWKWVRVADIWSVLNGDRGKNYPAKSTLSKTGIPFISALNLNGKTVVEDDRLLCLSEKQYDLLGNGKLIKGDIVVCIRGSLGKHGRYPFEKGAIASSLVIMRSRLQLPILDDFLMLYLDTPLFFSEIKKYDNGTAQPNLAAKSLEQFLFPLPPLAEQKRIVAKLEELLPLCERLSK